MSNDFDFDSYGLSELDGYILQLNHEGHSTRQISRLLKERHSVILGKSSIIRRLDELRQDPENDVQTNFVCTIPKKPRQENRWYKIIERLQNNLTEYYRVHGFKASSRTMYYQLLDEKILIGGSASEHKKYIEITRKARLGWVDADGELIYPKLDIDCFADDNSRLSSDLRQEWLIPKAPTDPEPIKDPKEHIDYYIGLLKSAVHLYDGIGRRGEDGKIGHRWFNQPEYVEVWQEKGDLHPAFEDILRGPQVNIKSGKGYPSLIFLNKCCKELKARIDRDGLDPESIHILYCGDWDPSGENIDWYIKRRLKQLGIEGIEFRRIAITPEQIEEFNLPLLSIDKASDKEQPNPNMREFVRRYGKKATHLNAFFTSQHFDTFKEILQDAVNKYWDPDIYQDMIDEYDVEAEEPDELDEEELEKARNKMVRIINKAFKAGWNNSG